jgi:hypothetical protein
MEPSTITPQSFTLNQGATKSAGLKSAVAAGPVTGTISYSGVTATFTPSSPLSPNTLYTGTIKNTVKDLVGNALQVDYVWSFTSMAQVTVLAAPTLGGTASGSGNFAQGALVTVVATPNASYSFVNWTENGVAVSTLPSYQFPMAANRILSANFSLKFAVNLSSLPIAGGTTLGSGLYAGGSSVTVTATPNAGYNFVNWTDNGVIASTLATYVFPITANKTLVANFASVAYTLTVNALNGVVVKNPNLLSYTSGASVVLTATANSGFKFVNWTGDATGIVSPVTVIMTGNKIVTANFIADVIIPGPLAIDLGCAAPFAVLAGSTITSTGPSIINGDVGLSPGSALIGFPAGIINGTKQITTPTAAAAKLCLTTAFLEGQAKSLNRISLPGQLGGLTLAPGLYSNSSTTGISGTGANAILTLDAQGDANASWVFQVGSTLTTDPGTSIVLAGGAQAKNIFWVVSTSATLGTNSVFYGNILAMQAITLNTGAVLNGRALTQIAAVSLDASTINIP